MVIGYWIAVSALLDSYQLRTLSSGLHQNKYFKVFSSNITRCLKPFKYFGFLFWTIFADHIAKRKVNKNEEMPIAKKKVL